MTPRRISKKPILSLPLSVPVAVICSNVNMHHTTVMIRYAFYGRGFIYDDPSFNEMIEIAKEICIPFTEWTFIESRCHSCRTGLPL